MITRQFIPQIYVSDTITAASSELEIVSVLVVRGSRFSETDFDLPEDV